MNLLNNKKYMNLFEETEYMLKKHGYSFEDVQYIQGNDFGITKEDFIKYSDVEYNRGFGCTHIAEDLTLIGEDFWITRGQYDGSEFWVWHQMPAIHSNIESITTLGGDEYEWSLLSDFRTEE